MVDEDEIFTKTQEADYLDPPLERKWTLVDKKNPPPQLYHRPGILIPSRNIKVMQLKSGWLVA